MVGVGTHPDHLGDRHHRAPTADTDPGTRFQILQRGADDDRDRQPVERAEFPAHQRDPPHHHQRVVLALSQAAVIVVDLGLRRHPRGARFRVIRVAHSRCGVLGEDRLPHHRSFRSQLPGDRGHRITALLTQPHSAFAGPLGIIRHRAVLIEQKQPQRGGVFEILRSHPGRDPHQIDLELPTGRGVDKTRQPVHRIADHRDMLGVDQSQRPGGRSRRQCCGQRLSGHRAPRRQHRRLTETAVGFAMGDPPPDRQHVLPRLGTQLLRSRLDLQPAQQPIPQPRQLTPQRLQLIERVDQLRTGQQVEIAGGHHIESSPQRGHRLLQHHPRTRHDSNIHSTTDTFRSPALRPRRSTRQIDIKAARNVWRHASHSRDVDVGPRVPTRCPRA